MVNQTIPLLQGLNTMSASGLPITQLGSTIKAHLSNAEKYEGKAEQHLKAAGIHLLEAQQRVEGTAKEYEGNFPKFLSVTCGIGRSRAYELIAIANGTKTVEEIREGARARDTKYREKMRRPSTTDTAQPVADQGVTGGNSVNSPPKRGRPAGHSPLDPKAHLVREITAACKALSVQQLQVVLSTVRSMS